MNNNNGFLIGYSSTGTIYHYVTGDGYKEDTVTGRKEIHYVDPNKYNSAAYGPRWIDASVMASVVNPRGIVRWFLKSRCSGAY